MALASLTLILARLSHALTDESISAIGARGKLGIEVTLTELEVGIVPHVTETGLPQQKRGHHTVCLSSTYICTR